MRWKTNAGYGTEEREEEIEERRKKVKEEDQPIVQAGPLAPRRMLLATVFLWSLRLVRSLTIIVAGSPPRCHLLPCGFLKVAPDRRRRPLWRRTLK